MGNTCSKKYMHKIKVLYSFQVLDCSTVHVAVSYVVHDELHGDSSDHITCMYTVVQHLRTRLLVYNVYNVIVLHKFVLSVVAT